MIPYRTESVFTTFMLMSSATKKENCDFQKITLNPVPKPYNAIGFTELGVRLSSLARFRLSCSGPSGLVFETVL